MSEKPYFLGEPNTEQFTVETYINGNKIGEQCIDDPFVRTTVVIGWRDILRALFRGLKVQVCVNGSPGAERAVMTLDPYRLEHDTNEILEERRRARESSPNNL